MRGSGDSLASCVNHELLVLVDQQGALRRLLSLALLPKGSIEGGQKRPRGGLP